MRVARLNSAVCSFGMVKQMPDFVMPRICVAFFDCLGAECCAQALPVPSLASCQCGARHVQRGP